MLMSKAKGYSKNTWVVSNPRILWRILRGFIRAVLFRKNTLRAIEIYPTMECNLSCSMCSVEKFKKNRGVPLTLDEYKKIAEEGIRLGALSATILGGEPLLVTNLEDIISIFDKKQYYTHIVTNSMLISEPRLRSLKKAGLRGICFSLDSMDKKKNDRIRGIDGHFEKVFESLRLARKMGFEVNMAPVFFPNKVQNGIDVVKFCQSEKIGASGTQVAPVGRWENGPVLSAEENTHIRSLLKEYPRLTFDWSLSYFLRMRCPAGKEKIAISNYGDVFGCAINPISFGNIRRESLKKILKRMQKLPEIKRDSPVCVAAEDRNYIEKYLHPLSRFDQYPVDYKNHPSINI